MESRMFSLINMNYHKLPDIEQLKRHYFDEYKSLSEIALIYGSSKTAVSLRFKRNNIPIRTKKEAWTIIANHIELTDKLLEELDGLLLGDGCLCPSNSISAWYSHGDKHPTYIKWLKAHLKTLSLECTIATPTKLYSKSYRELYDLRLKWYPNGKKKIPDDLVLTPTTLRNWYIGDGNYRPGKNGTKKCERVSIAVIKLDPMPLYDQFLELGFPFNKHKDGIYIPAKYRKKYFQYMMTGNPDIPNCYMYKFPMEVMN